VTYELDVGYFNRCKPGKEIYYIAGGDNDPHIIQSEPGPRLKRSDVYQAVGQVKKMKAAAPQLMKRVFGELWDYYRQACDCQRCRPLVAMYHKRASETGALDGVA